MWTLTEGIFPKLVQCDSKSAGAALKRLPLLFPESFQWGLSRLCKLSLPYTTQPTSSLETLLTLHQDPWESQFELLFSFFHLLLVSCLLVDEPAYVAVGWLDHGVKVVGSSPVHFPTFYPGQQGLDGFWELGVICRKKGQLYTTALGRPGQLSGAFLRAELLLQRSASFRWLITTPGSREGSEHVAVQRKASPAPSWIPCWGAARGGTSTRNLLKKSYLLRWNLLWKEMTSSSKILRPHMNLRLPRRSYISPSNKNYVEETCTEQFWFAQVSCTQQVCSALGK